MSRQNRGINTFQCYLCIWVRLCMVSGVLIIWATNWLIKPFMMYGIAYFFLFVVFKGAFRLGIQQNIFTAVPVMVTRVRIANKMKARFQ